MFSLSVYVYTYTYIYVYTHPCMHTRICIYYHACICVYVWFLGLSSARFLILRVTISSRGYSCRSSSTS
jgi:hypothetical protein